MALATPDRPMDEQKSTVALLKEALDETKELVRIEIELARADVKDEIRRSKHALIGFTLAASGVLVAICMLSVALVLALGGTALAAVAVAAGFLVAGALAAFVGYTRLPKPPLVRTRERLEVDINQFKEHLA
ncbi:MAG: phage holin family protein [Polyangiaceae bacterium]|nr:phage holin family protein [Polyangiaceae bacterium]